jgi:hypothetical protein
MRNYVIVKTSEYKSLLNFKKIKKQKILKIADKFIISWIFRLDIYRKKLKMYNIIAKQYFYIFSGYCSAIYSINKYKFYY